ncbi:alpha/beta fold hydrolase [Baekduia sp. Peel2402]|uniref:alpha/beta fold hydrolase n=1 Tax=Baekduia sp. Peel2402 TaxID=3458296 RepID=UPI00403E4651
MSRLSRLVLAVACCSSIAALPAVASAKVKVGPAGDAFYTAPNPLPGKDHGDAIWARTLKGAAVVPGASATKVVLYRSQDAHGAQVPVSGVVSVPKGKAPKGGWPVITWAHGTSGIADQCAPSRDDGTALVHAYHAYVFPLLTSWLKAGYAVVRTDYEGLGTKYDHQYLNGKAAGRGVLDMVRAARQVDPRLSKTTIIAGHSQGGHAALFAAALAPTYTRDLAVKGTIAFAPASHLDEQIPLTRSLTAPNPGLSGLVATIAYGLQAAYPDQFQLADFMTDAGVSLALSTQSKCLGDLPVAGVAPSSLFKPGIDLAPVAKLLDANDPSHLKIKTPVLVEQGRADTTVIPLFTDQLVTELKDNGGKPTYQRFAGVDHVGITDKGGPAATKWIKQRLR